MTRTMVIIFARFASPPLAPGSIARWREISFTKSDQLKAGHALVLRAHLRTTGLVNAADLDRQVGGEGNKKELAKKRAGFG